MTGRSRPQWWASREGASSVPPDGKPPAPTGQGGPSQAPSQAPGQNDRAEGQGEHGVRGHRVLMLVCCIPMLAVVIALVSSGAAGAGFIIPALVCVLMMTGMMFIMSGGHRH